MAPSAAMTSAILPAVVSLALHIAATQVKTVVALLSFLNGKPTVKHFVPILILPDFLLSVLDFGGQFVAGFLSRFYHGWSLLFA